MGILEKIAEIEAEVIATEWDDILVLWSFMVP